MSNYRCTATGTIVGHLKGNAGLIWKGKGYSIPGFVLGGLIGFAFDKIYDKIEYTIEQINEFNKKDPEYYWTIQEVSKGYFTSGPYWRVTKRRRTYFNPGPPCTD
jgi:hypothetical protein